MLVVIAATAGFVLGGLIVFVCQEHFWKKEQRKLVQKNKELRSQCTELKQEAEFWQAEASRRPTNVSESMTAAQHVQNASREKKRSVPSYTPKAEKKPDVPFRGIQDLMLIFQYTAPDSAYLQPGNGFLRSEKNELMPNPETFRMSNTTIGFAMGGMFYLYDVLYGGKVYSFQQILDREIGSGYVYLKRVHTPAAIQKSAGNESYTLSRKGLIEVVDAS